jgi:hypothetical protein
MICLYFAFPLKDRLSKKSPNLLGCSVADWEWQGPAQKAFRQEIWRASSVPASREEKRKAALKNFKGTFSSWPILERS